MKILLRPFAQKDTPGILSLWNASAENGEVVYSPLTAERFQTLLIRQGVQMHVAEAEGGVIGFIHGAYITAYLPDQTFENTPGFITALFVRKDCRGQGVGTALLDSLLSAFKADGKQTAACSGNNPINLPWRIPGTPGHDHNNAPGMDEGCAGYAFLQKRGFEPKFHEIAMYRTLKDYVQPPEIAELRAKLQAEGIYTGRYDPTMGDLEYDGMCTRVGSEYWRNVIRQELQAFKTGKPNQDPALWPDGIRPSGPRPMLVAVHNGHIIGFTGPVGLQKSGRGWFTGICSDPDFGRRGIGTVLFHLLMQEFLDEGAAFTTLFTGADNHAQRIYLGAGLRIVRRFCVMSRPLSKEGEYTAKHF